MACSKLPMRRSRRSIRACLPLQAGAVVLDHPVDGGLARPDRLDRAGHGPGFVPPVQVRDHDIGPPLGQQLQRPAQLGEWGQQPAGIDERRPCDQRQDTGPGHEADPQEVGSGNRQCGKYGDNEHKAKNS